MFIQAAQQVVLRFCIEFGFPAQAKINAAVEVFPCQKQRFVRVRCRYESGHAGAAALAANRLETLVNDRQQLCNRPGFAGHRCVAEPRPTLECVEAQAALVA